MILALAVLLQYTRVTVRRQTDRQRIRTIAERCIATVSEKVNSINLFIYSFIITVTICVLVMYLKKKNTNCAIANICE